MPRPTRRGTPRYTGRHPQGAVMIPETVRDERIWHTEMPGGLTRVDYGGPIPRLPSETQAVPKGTLKATESAPEAKSLVTGDEPERPPVRVQGVDYDVLKGPKPHRAITRNA